MSDWQLSGLLSEVSTLSGRVTQLRTEVEQTRTNVVSVVDYQATILQRLDQLSAQIAESVEREELRKRVEKAKAERDALASQLDMAERAAAESSIILDGVARALVGQASGPLDQAYAVVRDVAKLRTRVEELEKALDHDKTGLGNSLNRVREIARSYAWIPKGEWSSYHYTQRTEETLRREVEWCLEAIEKTAREALEASGALAQKTLCPPVTSPEKVPTYVVTDYISKNECRCCPGGHHHSYRNCLHDPTTDDSLDRHDVIDRAIKASGAQDGDEITVTVMKTGRRPFGDRRVVYVRPHTYERERGAPTEKLEKKP